MTAKRRVLVTGSTGAVGKTVTNALLRAGHQVVALSRSPSTGEEESVPNLQHVAGDILDFGRLLPLIAGVDVVCHLAAFVPPNFEDADQARLCIETNGLATLEIAAMACDLRKRFIYSSSGSVYAPGPQPAVEASPAYPAVRAPFYLGSKLLGEIYVEHFRQMRGLQSVIFRVGSVYGPEVTKSVVARFISSAMAGERIKVMHEGKVTTDFVYVEDVARLLVLAVEGDQTGLFNAGSGVATSILALAETICEVFPEFGLTIEHVPGRGPAPPSFPVLSMETACRVFAHQPTMLRDGLQLTRKYMMEKDLPRNA
jgi:UDP-glucose 4-epimerase